jgi:predicted nucleic acid-binding Zn ribbon protein
MQGWEHAIVIGFGCLGLIAGGILWDVDHTGNWRDVLRKFYDDTACPECQRGTMHKPVNMLSIATFSIFFGLGIVIHYMMDYLYVK